MAATMERERWGKPAPGMGVLGMGGGKGRSVGFYTV